MELVQTIAMNFFFFGSLGVKFMSQVCRSHMVNSGDTNPLKYSISNYICRLISKLLKCIDSWFLDAQTLSENVCIFSVVCACRRWSAKENSRSLKIW